MSIPKKIKIGGIVYEVKMINDFIKEFDNGRVILGNINFMDSTIRITTRTSPQKQYQTMLHEVIHGIVEDKQLDLGENDEEITEALAYGLLQVIKDNPSIFKEINK